MKTAKWAENRSKQPSTIAIIFASNSESYYQLAKLFKNREVFDGTFTLPPLSKWLQLYRNHRLVISVMTELQSWFGEYGQKANSLLGLMDEPPDPKKGKASEWKICGGTEYHSPQKLLEKLSMNIGSTQFVGNSAIFSQIAIKDVHLCT